MHLITIALAASLSTQPAANAPRADHQSNARQSPRNIILVIGDGMGVTHIAAASQLRHGPEGGLAIESMPYTGLMRHACADRIVTDSGAAATAMATGNKANYRVLSLDGDGRPTRTVAQAAVDQGLAVGMVTSTFLFDATPAAFLAHTKSRYDFLNIMGSMLESDATILIGGDNGFLFEDARATRELDDDQKQQWSQVLDRARSLGWTASLDEIPASISEDERALVLYSVRIESPDAFGPPLRESVAAALPRLAADPDGFFLLIESEETDEGAHVNDFERTMSGMFELDDALADALAFARARSDTLVIVTADHETGGLTIVGENDDGELDARWSTKDHSIEWVPVFAEGPGADRFTGVIDNTDIAKTIAELLGLQGVGEVID